MLDQIFNKIPQKHQGLIALVLGCLVLLGASERLGILQEFFYIIMIIAGLHLVLWGVKETNLLQFIKR